MHVIKKETNSTCIEYSQFKSAHAVTYIQGVIKNLIPVRSIIMLAAYSSDCVSLFEYLISDHHQNILVGGCSPLLAKETEELRFLKL